MSALLDWVTLHSVSLVLGLPLFGTLFFALVPAWQISATINWAISGLTFLAALPLIAAPPQPGLLIHVDGLNTVLLELTTFVAFTTSLFSSGYLRWERKTGRIGRRTARLYHAVFQGLMFSMNLALLANNIGLMWVAIELATLGTVLMVGLYQTPEALEAAWKYFILGGVGVALALFGTILVYLAAIPSFDNEWEAMAWTHLAREAGAFDPALLNLAFVFLLMGYGTKVGLFPVHAWLPDAHAEGPTPITAVLSGLLINVSLHVVLRFKMMLAANLQVLPPGPVMVGIGLLSLFFAAVMLFRRTDIKRLFAYSSIEHMGIVTIAFGLGGPVASFAGLLHMVMHSLAKSAVFFAVGNVTQLKGSQKIAAIRGLTSTHPALGWALVIGVLAVAGLPPSGVFVSEFLLLTTSFGRSPLLALALLVGLLLALSALVLHLNGVAFGEPEGSAEPAHASRLPVLIHLSLVVIAGVWLPGPLAAWLRTVAEALG
jgi:hydrogenase-4 component F